MPKVILEFQLPEENEEFEDAINGTKSKIKLDSIWDEVFRPYYKHGYSGSNSAEKLNLLLLDDKVQDFMEELTELYREKILKDE